MFKPINVVTEDVAEELKDIAKKYSVLVSNLYVILNSVTTFIKTDNSDFLEVSGNELGNYTQQSSLRDNTIEFKQEYNVDILLHYEGYPFGLMNCEVEFEKNDTLAYLVIKKGSKLNYYDGLYDGFLDFINEQKLRENIMFHFFDTDYEKSIEQLADIIKKTKTITFKEDKKILIAKGFDEIKSINAEVHMTIEDKIEDDIDDENQKIDHSDRSFLLSCSKGDELFEFIKPLQGEHGRNTKGKIIEVDTVNLDSKPMFTIEDGIEVHDSFENIKYLSKKSGYLIKEDEQYKVSNSIDLDEISFKTTGTIDSDLDTEISINVIKDDPLVDAVEEGMYVKVQQISINGSIGPNTKIEARSVSIDGQTHPASSIQCVEANLGVHKGKVVGRDVEVKTLEGGEIIADKATIIDAMRGSVSAKIIVVRSLGSHVTLRAAESIEIQRIRGEENTLIIDESFESGFDNKKDDDEEYFLKTKSELTELEKLFKLSSQKLKANLDTCNKIKAAIIKAKKEGKQLSQKMIDNFKTCKILQVRYKKIKDKLEYKKAQYDKIQKRLSLPKRTIFDAHIRLKEPLTGYNTIIYKLSKPEREIELKVDETMTKKVFKLIEDDDGIYKIINTN